jgi:6-phosphofructokinase 1
MHTTVICAAVIHMISRNEASSNVYTTAFLTKMLEEEGGKLFDARSASLGHTLQGGVPSPLDRARAVRLALKCMAFLEEHNQALLQQGQKRHASPDTAAVITIQSSSLEWVPVQVMYQHADMQNRRGKGAWWSGMKELTEALGAKPQFLGVAKEELKSASLGI